MAASIKAIDAASVHQITSGQVITDLQTAVKELVENSLDAGATNIDIKFKNHGSTSFEVLDNGSGITPEDYNHIALKGYTSKLESYDDLTSVTSFGFRGEALSSLCQLADVTITTASEAQAPIGTVLTFDKTGGLLASSSKTARSKGTTVHIASLFSAMPVRKKEFDRNSKKHFAAAQTLLQAYGLISVGKRISLQNQQEGKPMQTLFKTDGKSIRDNYAILFGAKSALPLQDLDLELQVEATKRVLKTMGLSELNTHVRVRGLISPPNANAGRTSGDRQFLYVNGRPFEAKAICKAFNEVYKTYVPQHFPSIVADFELATDSYDVNVSPDKRSIFLHSEQNLIEALKTALDVFYSPSRATFSLDSTNMTKTGRLTATAAPPAASGTVSVIPAVERPSLKRTASSNASEITVPHTSLEITNQDQIHEHEPRDAEDHSTETAASLIRNEDQEPLFRQPSLSVPPHIETATISDDVLVTLPTTSAKPQGLAKGVQAKLSVENSGWSLASSVAASQPVSKRARRDKVLSSEEQATLDRMEKFSSRASGPARPTVSRESSKSTSSSIEEIRSEDIDLEDEVPGSEQVDEPKESNTSSLIDIEQNGAEHRNDEVEVKENDLMVVDESDIVRTDSRKSITLHSTELDFDIEDLRGRLAASRERQRGEPGRTSSVVSPGGELENAGIKTQDEDARKILSRLVSKEDFAKMKVVGQFNLAFIIARRREAIHDKGQDSETSSVRYHDDLMIIECVGLSLPTTRADGYLYSQHASDEKYNFERLQQVTKIDSQRLIKPRLMELPASDELLAIEHENVLRFNGFEIEVDEDAPVGQRIKLVSMPISKSTKKTEFTVDDFEELLFLLRERTSPGMIRPSKTRKLFAMLACRSSVMVGKVLNTSQMTTIVKHMGTMDQPWNCPHGRNTMRWLTGLEMHEPDKRFQVSTDTWKKFEKSG